MLNKQQNLKIRKKTKIREWGFEGKEERKTTKMRKD